jgi:Phage integrase family
MIRAGVSLPVVKELLGHSDIRMTMVYVAVTQNDLQRQYHRARQILSRIHVLPELPSAQDAQPASARNPSCPPISGHVPPSPGDVRHNWRTKQPDANSLAWQIASSRSAPNLTNSLRLKNEHRLAGQRPKPLLRTYKINGGFRRQKIIDSHS